MSTLLKFILFASMCLFIFYSPDTLAELTNKDVLDGVLEKYKTHSATWPTVITKHALWLFWILVTISMVVTFGMLLLKKADIAEFFAEFIKFTLLVGFFLWLLLNASQFSIDVIKSLLKIGADASGFSGSFTPSAIVDVGFRIFDSVVDATSITDPVDSAICIIVGLIILLNLALIAINMLLLMITAWFLAYSGIFFLGFGGSKWTSDIAINYYKTVLGLSAQLLAMVLLVGVGQAIMLDFENSMSGNLNINELAIMFIVSLTLFILTDKVPAALSGIISGSSIGGQGMGGFGAGAAIGAAAGAAAGAAMMSSAISSLGTQTAGAGSAIMAAFKDAQNSMASSGGGIEDTGSTDTGGGDNTSSLAEAMGSGESSSSSGFSSGSTDTGSADTGSANTGSTDTGSADTGSANTGSTDTGSTDTGSADTGSADTGSANTGSADTGSADTDSANTGSANTGSADTGSADTGSADTGSADTGSTDTGSADTGSADTGSTKPKGAMAFAGAMASSLAKGAAASISNTAGGKIDSIKEAISQTAGGKIADEINNPGQAKQARSDSKDIAKAQRVADHSQLREQGEQARQFLSGNQEVNDFVNKDK